MVSVAVQTNDDEINELDENFEALLESPTGGAVIGSASSAEVTIQDDDGRDASLTFKET